MLEVVQFLKASTPRAWLQQAVENIDLLLIDHAHCEKKAASTALQLMFRYVDRVALLEKMSQLAREELLHFEQVLGFIQARDIKYIHLSASHYAQRLRQPIRAEEPYRLIDTLIVGAVIEARSCERFAALADYFEGLNVHPELVKYYRFLLKSESRHFLDYLELARQASSDSIDERIELFLQIDIQSIQTEDYEFRFHSGALPVIDVPTNNASGQSVLAVHGDDTAGIQ